MKDTVYVFARAPRLGTVKRRLARGIGDRAALQFYRLTLEALLRRLAKDPRFRTIVAVTPDHAAARWPRGIGVIAQGHGGLGERLHRACARYPRGRVAVVGSDIPGLVASDVALAFSRLGRAQACFGPATDGGYWLVALSPRRPARPFETVRWSTENALADTLKNQGTRRIEFLRVLRDIDTVDDLRAANAGARLFGPHLEATRKL